ncbi:hypothetical protein C2869_20990 [Saccharobesus litoralis]|uniref:DUF4266 domain-containing protein n=1 Tax=Saccharobesus litoralis TaxID=2172099 RepID=A0A2S0VWX9_9ALTE|nr:DUF4266 domain-containing protein [Saccharobesus litoralis]AWB68718.1 hypothetical protein C2869_20990 [Saccharobesus litoralis]
MKLSLMSLLALCLLLSACANVKPWEKGNLAKPEMNWQPDSMQAAMNKQVYFSKEASSGGTSTAGGGCGCN